MIATVVLFIILYRVVSSFLRKYYDDLAKVCDGYRIFARHHFWVTFCIHGKTFRQEQGTIEKALEATQELAFPMVLLKAHLKNAHEMGVIK